MNTLLLHADTPSTTPARPELFGIDQRAGFAAHDHVAPGDDHDARLETLCVGESR